MAHDTGVFDMDTDGASSTVNRDGHADTQSQATSSVCEEPSSLEGHLERRGSIDMCRRAVPVIEAEEDICSICLDEFTEEDPGNPTVCGHQYHLQCIMQWAQRSRECPMCFKTLQLQDPNVQELLPFGEYVPPEHAQPAGPFYMGLEAWELERILARLAVTNGANALQPGRRRGQSRAEPVIVSSDRGRGAASSSSGGQENAAAPDQAAPSSSCPEGAFPSSWPPHSGNVRSSESANRRSPSRQDYHSRSSVSHDYPLKTAAESFKSRWTAMSMKCKEGFSKLSRQTNQRLAPRNPHAASDGEGSSSTAA